MRAFLLVLAMFPVAAPAQDNAQSFRLAPGDFRWVEFTIRQTPAEVECRYQVLTGQPTVHAELLPRGEFRQLYRGREHHAMTSTPPAASGNFRQVIAAKGQYALVLLNERGAPPATVSLDFRTTIDPRPGDISRGLSPQRRLTVILLSFAVFFVTVAWTGRKLLRAMGH
jgi:hypothetical protein